MNRRPGGGLLCMILTCHISVSLDGFAAGPNQDAEHPLGEGGERLHEWYFNPEGVHPVDAEAAEQILAGNGAYIMGRRMFGGGEGPWDTSWRGWWGETPPYHAPVFVLTHHAREPLEMGDTTFRFVTGGIHEALDRARAAAGDRNVAIGGGASTVQQFLAAKLLDELNLHLAPVLLGGGERLFENVGDVSLQPTDVTASPFATHVRYRVRR
jgi:dihydrofolate reductase